MQEEMLLSPDREYFVNDSDSDSGSDHAGCTDQLVLHDLRETFTTKAIAPSLHDNLQYHAYFLYHNNDRNWVLRLIERLETPALGFRSCCFERNFDIRTSPAHVLRYGTKHALKTVIVLSPDFVSDNWCTWEMVILSQVDVLLVHRDILVIVLQECDIPEPLSEYACVDVSQEDWWTHLVAHLCSSDHSSGADQSGLTSASSLVGLNPRLQSGHLLASIKSRCYCCGKEVVDDTEIPEELISFGIQVPQEEYREAISHLMLDAKFSCHVWCYNVPAAIAFFTLLLGLCLSVIPLLEIKFFYNGSETGLEFVHGGVVWLCSLTVYMVIVQISKRKMKVNIYKRLCQVNTQLIKYNVLAGLENLGLADCNKYYVHFFYFEIGPCLGYLQELMVNLVEGTACFQNQTAESPEDVSIEMDCDLEQVTAASDKMRVLDSTNITNSSVQTQAEDLLLGHSGEYVSLLITKKLERPHRQRHVAESPCLCQFVEHRVYKMIV